jgi:ADP-ribose pyrophosphatase
MPDQQHTLLETRRFNVVECTVTRADGRQASVQFVDHAGSVAILPLVDDDHLCLIRNHRLTVHQTLVELPAGTREPDEPPAETARRELIEETGYRAARFEEMPGFYPSPGIINERMYLFLATGLVPGQPQREENEQIDNLVVSWDEALAMIDRGEIQDGKTIVAILAYDRRRREEKN